MYRRIGLWAALAAMTLGGTAATRACFMRSLQPVQVWLDNIDVEITDQVAVKTYDCTFLNPNPRPTSGVCYMEVEPDTQVDNMTLTVNGKEQTAEILDVKEANKVFAEVVKTGGTVALLEYYGNKLIQSKVPVIPANGTVHVKLKYTTVLDKRGGLVRMQMLNTNPKALMQPLKHASVRISIRSTTPVKNVYSPTHEIKITERPEWDVVAEWQEDNYLPKTPFVFYYQTDEDDVAAGLLAHRELGEDGHFMLMLSPTMGASAKVDPMSVLPKDIVFCIDTSGSMIGDNKMEQAIGALQHCVRNLNPQDRFNIVDFGTGVRSLADSGLVEATEENKGRAMNYAAKLAARGGTAMGSALEKSFDLLGQAEGRMRMVLFATDGLPTIGEREPDALLKQVASQNKHGARLFVFGEGHDVNARLLDLLAQEHQGESEYILPKEDIQKKIAAFYDRVGSPLLTDVKIEIDGVPTSDLLPSSAPDLFKGKQLIVYGRYHGSGKATVKLSGRSGDSVRTFEYQVEFPEVSVDDRQSFVPRLWAGEKVDEMLTQLRKLGKDDDKLIAEITHLAKRYGIITPFTSFLVVDDLLTQTAAEQQNAFKKRLASDGNLLGKQDGKLAVEKAKEQAAHRRDLFASGNANSYYRQTQLALQEEGRQCDALQAVRNIGNRTFYNNGNVWCDSRFELAQQKQLQNIQVGSPAFLRLIEMEPALAKYAAMEDVVVEHKGQWYRFEGKLQGQGIRG